MQSPSEEPYVDSFYLPRGILDPDDDERTQTDSDHLLHQPFSPLNTWSAQEFAHLSQEDSAKSSSLLGNHVDSALSPIVHQPVASECPATPNPSIVPTLSLGESNILGDAYYALSSPSGRSPAMSSSRPPGFKSSMLLPSGEPSSPPFPDARRRESDSSKIKSSTPFASELETEKRKSYASVVALANTTPSRERQADTSKSRTGALVPPPIAPFSPRSSSRSVDPRGDSNGKPNSSRSNPTGSDQALSRRHSTATVVKDDPCRLRTDSKEKCLEPLRHSSSSSSNHGERDIWSREITAERIGQDVSSPDKERSQASPPQSDQESRGSSIEESSESIADSQSVLDGTDSPQDSPHAEPKGTTEAYQSDNRLVDSKEASSISSSTSNLIYFIRSRFAKPLQRINHAVMAFSRFFQSVVMVYSVVAFLAGKCVASTVTVFVTAAKVIILMALALESICRSAVAEIEQGSGPSYAVLYLLPLLCDAIMTNFSLPHYTPHFISTLAICHVCQPLPMRRRSVSSSAASEAQLSEDLSRTVLRSSRYLLLALELWEGFSESNMSYMRADAETRLLLAYVLSLARSNLLLSPIAWVLWASQYLSTCYVPGNIVTEFLLILIGLASIRLSSSVLIGCTGQEL